MSDGLIHFACPICQTRLATRADNAEHHVQCPGCDSVLTVPFLPSHAPTDDRLVAEPADVDFRTQYREPDAEMDMTPMVDVTFLLLIFFMVTAAFTMQRSFQLPAPNEEVPSTQVQQSSEDDVITVRIDEFNTFHVSTSFWDEEQEAPSEQELLRRLREAKAGDGRGNIPNTMIVEASGEATHEKVVMALDAGSDLGMEEVKLRTIEDSSE
jgi:biopolymer transport protein ExbD